ncbi:hypothetical protein BAUCODRAFT_80005, partial [Baudoinia panamericana UAMH 10762]
MYRNPDGNAPTVHYCKTLIKAEEQLKHFLGQPVLGFDIEWEPMVKKTAPAKQNVSLIQLAIEDRIILIHVALFAGNGPQQLMPTSLRMILESDSVMKVGVNIQGDARRIHEYLGVQMRAQFELSHLYKVVTFTDRKAINKTLKGASLQAQVKNILLLPLKKDDVRVSSWSRALSKEQSDYSASDAYAGFRLFHALEAKRKAMEPTPPRPAFYE